MKQATVVIAKNSDRVAGDALIVVSDRASLALEVAKQRLRLAKDELKRARKRFKEAKREVKRARKHAAAARKASKRARKHGEQKPAQTIGGAPPSSRKSVEVKKKKRVAARR